MGPAAARGGKAVPPCSPHLQSMSATKQLLLRAIALSEQGYVLIRRGVQQGKHYYRVNLRAQGREYRGTSQTSVQEALARACKNVAAARSSVEQEKAVHRE
jgi:hypothetical protein